MENDRASFTQQASQQADFNFRLDHILEILGFESDASFARHLGVTPQVVHNWRQRLISFNARDLFEEKTGYSWRWANTGHGQATLCAVDKPFVHAAVQAWMSKSLFEVASHAHQQSALGQILQHLPSDRINVFVIGCCHQQSSQVNQCGPIAAGAGEHKPT